MKSNPFLNAKVGRPTIRLDGRPLTNAERQQRFRDLQNRKKRQLSIFGKSEAFVSLKAGVSVCLLVLFVTSITPSAQAGWLYFSDSEYISPQFAAWNVINGTWDTVLIGVGGVGGDYVTGGIISPLDLAVPYPSLTGLQVSTIINQQLTIDPAVLDPLNPINATKIGADFFQYGSYMLGVSLLGLSFGIIFGGVIGLIRKNVKL